MNDQRTSVFRNSLEQLVESLDATLSLARLEEGQDAPDSVRDSAARLVSRLGTSERLSAGIFKGNPRDVKSVSELTEAMRRLDAAYVAYRKELGSFSGAEAAKQKLADALERVKTETLT